MTVCLVQTTDVIAIPVEQPAQVHEHRLAHQLRLRRAVRASLNLYCPHCLPSYLAQEQDVGVKLHINRLHFVSGALNPSSHFTAEEWASLVSLRLGVEDTASSLGSVELDKGDPVFTQGLNHFLGCPSGVGLNFYPSGTFRPSGAVSCSNVGVPPEASVAV